MFSVAECPRLGTATQLGVFATDSPEWHEARLTRLGGSEIAPILGLSPFESRYSLWHRKRGLIGPTEVNAAMHAGNLLEPVIIGEFARQHPELHVRTKVGTWVHRDRGWQLANPDALAWTDVAGEPAVVEAKFSGRPDKWGPAEAGIDGLPVYYRTQVLWYLDVLGLRVAYLIVLIGQTGEFRTYRIEAGPDEAAEQKYMRVKGGEFMADLAAGIVPDLDGHSATYTTVKELHPDIEDVDVQLDAPLAWAYLSACEMFDVAKDRRNEYLSRVADAIGGARRGLVGDLVIARRQAKGDGIPYVVRVADTQEAA